MASKFHYGEDRAYALRDILYGLIDSPLLPSTIVAVLIAYDQVWCVPPLGDPAVEKLVSETASTS